MQYESPVALDLSAAPEAEICQLGLKFGLLIDCLAGLKYGVLCLAGLKHGVLPCNTGAADA